MTELIPVAVLGFVVMLLSATYALSALRARPTPSAHDQGSLHDRMDRWRHRHED
ncbi:hypothetical protein [Nocardioides cavernaquae]|uniref:hypothetical protein n=1 Tax=Nocardioides cavernaquae TaxID=2321396 RepID=UPI001EE53A96|nr:hypothetical protein [Nocardioides cavernaquae]